MIQGYATPSSLVPGEKVTIHVTTDDDQATKFRMYFFRAGETWHNYRAHPTFGPPRILTGLPVSRRQPIGGGPEISSQFLAPSRRARMRPYLSRRMEPR
jgi:hypothetical protein